MSPPWPRNVHMMIGCFAPATPLTDATGCLESVITGKEEGISTYEQGELRLDSR